MDNNVRPESMARINTPELAEAFIAEQVELIKQQVGDKKDKSVGDRYLVH